MPDTDQPLLQWEILTEHLGEAAIAFERFEHARRSGDYTLSELEDWIERRWLAHVEALEIAGEPLLQRMLVPLLEDPAAADRFALMTAVALALRAGRWPLLQTGLWSDDPDLCGAVMRACALFADARFDAWIVGALARSAPPYRARVLRLAALRHLAPTGFSADDLHPDGEPAELEAALLAIRSCDPGPHRFAVDRLLDHGNLEVRDAAIVTGLHFGSKDALDRCRQLAASETTCTSTALRMLALLGDPRDHGYVVQAASWSTWRKHALRYLGFTGNLAAVDLLLPVLAADDATEAKLASESLVLLTGIDARDETLLREPANDDASDEVDEATDDPAIEPDAGSPLFDAAALTQWWTAHRSEYDASRRHLRGDADLAGSMLRLLDSGRMRDRPDVALSLAIRSGGRIRIDCDALVSRQREQLRTHAGTRTNDLGVHLTSW